MSTNDILAKLATQLGQKDIDNYIKQLNFCPSNSSEECLVFRAPNAILARYIQTKFADRIAQIIELETGKKPAVKITANAATSDTAKPEPNVVRIKSQSSLINPSHTFENFIVGDSNQFAFISSQQVAQNPATAYNPLFIYGSTGLGKTHLLEAIGNHCLNSGLAVICINSEKFMGDFIAHVEQRSMTKFKEKYRNCDLLLIDDVQFFSKSERIQEEFFHTFNELHSKGGQIVLTSDKPPKQMHGFEERLRTRFEWGLMADITPPELDTKIRIIKAKCEFDDIYLNDEIVRYIAINMGDNIREIESAIININAFSKFLHQEITLDFAKNVIKDQIKARLENITLESIIDTVAKETNIRPNDIKSKTRTKAIVEARRICIYLAKNLTPNSMPQLANFFGLKDHSAVSHNIKKINEEMSVNDYFKTRIEELKNKITTKEV